MDVSAASNKEVLFSVEDIQDWKNGMNVFKPLVGIKKCFAYKIHI